MDDGDADAVGDGGCWVDEVLLDPHDLAVRLRQLLFRLLGLPACPVGELVQVSVGDWSLSLGGRCAAMAIDAVVLGVGEDVVRSLYAALFGARLPILFIYLRLIAHSY